MKTCLAGRGGITGNSRVSFAPREGFEVTPQVLFVCVGNRVRSAFAEFFMTDMFDTRGLEIAVSSAGFVPKMLQDQLTQRNIPSPKPFYNRPMSELTITALREKGIRVPKGWRSKELSPEMTKKASLLITALGIQKEELSALYIEDSHKIFSIRELSETEDYLFFEDFSKVPMKADFWLYCEEDPKYVLKTLRVWEEALIQATPNIIKQL